MSVGEKAPFWSVVTVTVFVMLEGMVIPIVIVVSFMMIIV